MKDLETGETREATAKVDLTDVIRREAKRLNVTEGDAGVSRGADRETLLEMFVPAFAAPNLRAHVDRVY